MKASVMVATFPYGGQECKEVRNWLLRVHRAIDKDKRVAHLHTMDVDDTPITMSRNRVIKECLRKEIDFCLMVDSDMKPDMYLGAGDVKPFWESSFEFMLNHQGPCVVAAPYCGPPPHENVYVFRWAAFESGQPNPDFKLEQYPREEATIRIGIEQVAALPTGVCLIDMRAIRMIETPWFDYEWEDAEQTQKASTEDVFFTRNLCLAGVPQYVNWDAWAGHVKRKIVGRPLVITADSIRGTFREALIRGFKSNERIIDVPVGGIVNRPELFEADEPVAAGGRRRKKKAS